MNKATYLGRQALKLYSEVDPILSRRAAEADATCRRGCSHCCQMLVMATFIEALAIAAHIINEGRDGEVLRGMAEQVALLRVPNLTQGLYFANRRPCVLLRDGTCSIYDVRPYPCRSFYAVTPPEVCGDPSGETMVCSPDMRDMNNYFTASAVTICVSSGIRPFVAPLQVIVPWAVRLIREGRPAFERAVDADRDITGLLYWLELAGSDEGALLFEE